MGVHFHQLAVNALRTYPSVLNDRLLGYLTMIQSRCRHTPAVVGHAQVLVKMSVI
ncbi:hypothetical protein DENSPDRAFT_838926 [Dentipellis sp. KUC8613]|nr:hypothetical protein DENSPDRAFT_838926 [Dentipellis sp. KUC8613]